MMATESERCVDELLRRQTLAEQLLARFQELERQNLQDDQLVGEARGVVSGTQAFIDSNKPIIPAYCLKKVSDAMRKLELNIDKPRKSNFQFKFKPASREPQTNPNVRDKIGTSEAPVSREASETTPALGFRDETKQNLSLGKDEVRSRDVSLVNLDQCRVNIIGPANTVYIRNLTQTTVTVFLACRAITVINCRDCHFKLVCQQLRIDSTHSSKFNMFTSTRSMLESSEGLEFAELKLDDGLDFIKSDEIDEFLRAANFNKLQNNWKCIDDFDWLSPSSQSKNFTILSEPSVL